MQMRDPSDYDMRKHPLSNDPIAEQVADISLPDGRPLRPSR